MAAGMIADRVISHLPKARQTAPGRWISHCPAHCDRSPSLAVRELDDGRVLVHCFAGCETEDVLAAVGLKFADLYPDRAVGHRQRPMRHNPRDLLLLARRETWVVMLAAEAVAKGNALNPTDSERLLAAANRLMRIANEAR